MKEPNYLCKEGSITQPEHANWGWGLSAVLMGLLKFIQPYPKGNHNQPTPWHRVFLEMWYFLRRLINCSMLTLKFITVFTKARHFTTSWDGRTQSTILYPISLRPFLILFFQLVSSLQVLRPKLCMQFLYATRRAHFIINIRRRVWTMKLLLIQISQFYGYFLFPRAKYSSQHFLSNIVRSPDTAAVVGPIFVVFSIRFF